MLRDFIPVWKYALPFHPGPFDTRYFLIVDPA